MSKPAKSSTIIELHVPDFELAKKFYGKLGFEIVWEKPSKVREGYLVMKMGDNVLCFSGGNEFVRKHSYFKRFLEDTKRGYGVEIVVFVGDVERYFEKISKFANVVKRLTEQPWEYKDFRIEDPFGFYIRFSAPYNTLYAEKSAK